MMDAASGGVGGELSAFTFWVGDTLCAVEVPHVLSVEQDLDRVQPTPFRIHGLIGAIKRRDRIVPVFDLALLLGMRLLSEQKEELIGDLSAREQDHIDWLDALMTSIRDKTPFTKARDPGQCAFGKWYAKFHSRDAELVAILAQFERPHRRIHALADRLLDRVATGQAERALRELAIERRTTLEELRRLFARARRQVRDSMKSVLLFLTSDGALPELALRLDEISDIVAYTRDRLLPATDLNHNRDDTLAEVFPHYIAQQDGPDCLLVDAERLVAMLTGGDRRAAS